MLSGVTNGSHWNTFFVHDGNLSPKRVFAIEHHACEQVQRQVQGLDVPGMPTMKVAVRMHMPTKSANVFSAMASFR